MQICVCKTDCININARHLLNQQNTFEHGGESWEIIDIKVWDKIQTIKEKTDFIFKYLPSEIKTSQTWDSVIIRGEERALVDQSLYKKIVRTYIWVPIDSIPPNHRHKGEGIEGENILVLKKNLLGTFRRYFHSRG